MSPYKRILSVVYLIAIAAVGLDVLVWRSDAAIPAPAAECEPTNGCGLPAHPPKRYKK